MREKNYLEKKSAEKDLNFHDKCNRQWELCKNCYDKFVVKPEDPCWDVGEFDPFLPGYAANMRICQLLFRLVLI